MSVDKLVRETQRMQQLVSSVSIASEVAKSAEIARLFQSPELENLRLVNQQYSELLKSIKPITLPKFDVPRIDFPELNAAVKASLGLSKIFKEMSSPLTLSQTNLLKGIQLPNLKFEELAAKLAADAQLLGEFEPEDEEEEDESPESTLLSDEVSDRFELVQFLPLRLMDAIAESPELLKGLDPRDFEKVIAELLATLEFENVILTPRSGDGGRDVLATKVISGIPLMFSFECKRYAKKIGLDIMRGLLGSVVHSATKSNIGVLVTTSFFTRGARNFIVSEPQIDGKDFGDLVGWLNAYKQSKR